MKTLTPRAMLRYVATGLWALVRVAWVTLTNIYSIPAHMLVMTLLMPMKLHLPDLYYYLDGVLFRWLQHIVAHWMYSAGYKVAECGDDLSDMENEEVLLLVNHQSTSDVPALMYALQFHDRVLDKIMWVMDVLFKYSNFGWISQLRGDFFIQQGKETRAMQGPLLEQHIKDYYIPRKREWIVVFPEGAFLYKQKRSSQAYGRKNQLPHLEHCMLPRVGAVHAILRTLNPEVQTNGRPPSKRRKTLKWVVDVTMGYPEGKPLNLSTIIMGHRGPVTTVIHYRRFPVSEVPTSQDQLLQWLYERYEVKDRLLAEFYQTGRFPPEAGSVRSAAEPRLLELSAGRRFGVHLFFIALTCCLVRLAWAAYTTVASYF